MLLNLSSCIHFVFLSVFFYFTDNSKKKRLHLFNKTLNVEVDYICLFKTIPTAKEAFITMYTTTIKKMNCVMYRT